MIFFLDPQSLATYSTYCTIPQHSTPSRPLTFTAVIRCIHRTDMDILQEPDVDSLVTVPEHQEWIGHCKRAWETLTLLNKTQQSLTRYPSHSLSHQTELKSLHSDIEKEWATSYLTMRSLFLGGISDDALERGAQETYDEMVSRNREIIEGFDRLSELQAYLREERRRVLQKIEDTAGTTRWEYLE